MSFRLCLSRISRLDSRTFSTFQRVSNNRSNKIPQHSIPIYTMDYNSRRGALLVFEGLDRSGKSTQSKLLVESLNKAGKLAELMVFPDRTTPIGKVISEYLSNKSYELNDQALHLLFTANRFENMNKMKKLLAEGTSVVVDRYSFSGIVFSSAKNGMNADWCKYPETGLPAPDVVYFLELPLEKMKMRRGFGDERYENVRFQTKVLAEYESLSREFDFFKKIDASGSVDEIQQKIWEHALGVIDKVTRSRLCYLDFIEREQESYKKENISINF